MIDGRLQDLLTGATPGAPSYTTKSGVLVLTNPGNGTLSVTGGNATLSVTGTGGGGGSGTQGAGVLHIEGQPLRTITIKGNEVEVTNSTSSGSDDVSAPSTKATTTPAASDESDKSENSTAAPAVRLK
jgi:hypothetical protein